ncbi:MAG: class I SAM-dependent methyltransferase [Candidatus Moranbacteria bacterium]|nr:class I SAM-dependent methyltransferase [Candidatus Moranbacteria bacterium]
MSLIEKTAYSISARSRERKYGQFLDLVAPQADETILDVGANVTEYSETDNFLERHYEHPERITVLGVGDITPIKERYPSVTVVSGDGRILPFPDHSFDIAYSNAVIEHVGSRDDQLRFLRELFRVGKRGYLTTPNRHFPIEVHTRIPLLHLLLPKPLFDRFLRLIGKEWAAGDYMNLLSEGDLRAMLAEAGIHDATVIRNRFLGFTMTFTVMWKKS